MVIEGAVAVVPLPLPLVLADGAISQIAEVSQF